jgi:hypothetical protein
MLGSSVGLATTCQIRTVVEQRAVGHGQYCWGIEEQLLVSRFVVHLESKLLRFFKPRSPFRFSRR